MACDLNSQTSRSHSRHFCFTYIVGPESPLLLYHLQMTFLPSAERIRTWDSIHAFSMHMLQGIIHIAHFIRNDPVVSRGHSPCSLLSCIPVERSFWTPVHQSSRFRNFLMKYTDASSS